MNNKKRHAMNKQMQVMREYEDYLESRNPEKLVQIWKIIKNHEYHKESESEDCIIYTVLFKNNTEAHKSINELQKLGCDCYNESYEFEDYDGQDLMWEVSWTRKTIYG